jgi:hypothetical protein
MGGGRSLGWLVCVLAGTPTPVRVAAVLPGARRLWATTLRTSSATVIASPLSPVHLAAVAMRCRENVEAANVLAQLLRHPRITVGGLTQCPVGSRSCDRPPRTLFWPAAKRECTSVAGESMEVCFPRGAGRARTACGCPLMALSGLGWRRSCNRAARLRQAAGWYRIVTCRSTSASRTWPGPESRPERSRAGR